MFALCENHEFVTARKERHRTRQETRHSPHWNRRMQAASRGQSHGLRHGHRPAGDLCRIPVVCGIKGWRRGCCARMWEVFDDPDTDCLLLVDASNAFHRLSRHATLWNCRVLWPRCSRYLFNSYRGYPVVIFCGADRSTHVILSREGTTQGCPLAMFMYAAGVMPLVTKLKDPSCHRQNWFADDSSCGGRLQRVYEWFVNLQALGPAYGYFPESS